MKKTLSLALILGSMFCLKAQGGDFFYTNFEPDLCISVQTSSIPHDTIKVDFDNNGTIDLRVYFMMVSTGEIYPYIETTWDCLRFKRSNDDTIPSDTLWNNPLNATLLIWPYIGAVYNEAMVGFKKNVDDANYYAWVRLYAERIIQGTSSANDKIWAYVDQYACCTIPNYPLRWGQTSLDWSVDENTKITATIHPNPAKDLITIDLPNEGYCKSIEIFSIDGRLLETFSGTSQQTTIDISGLYAGMYIIKIRMADDSEFSEKIIKP